MADIQPSRREPVDAKTASAPDSWEVATYTYIYRSSYGSPEVDGTKPLIQSVTVAPDGMSARVMLDAIQQGHVHEFHLPGVRSAQGAALLHDSACYTLIYIPQS